MRELALNRPVYLAGRDACYEHAVKLLQADLMNYDVADRLEKCRALTATLQLASRHAGFALRGVDCSRDEKLFARFLELLLDSAQALLVMTQHEHLLMSDREFLRELLGPNLEMIDRSAAEHRQLANNLLRETIQLTQMVKGAFEKLRQENLSDFGKDDWRERYRRAYASFQHRAA